MALMDYVTCMHLKYCCSNLHPNPDRRGVDDKHIQNPDPLQITAVKVTHPDAHQQKL